MRRKEKRNIFEKVIKFIEKLFGKKNNILIESSNGNNSTAKDNIIEEISKENKILMMQSMYEEGSIKEEDLTSEEKTKLMELYKRQIKTLEENKLYYINELKRYKEKILDIRSKIDNN